MSARTGSSKACQVESGLDRIVNYLAGVLLCVLLGLAPAGNADPLDLVPYDLMCGPACLLLLSDHYSVGEPSSDDVNRWLSLATEGGKGMSMSDLVECLRELEIPAIAVEFDIADVAELGASPSIVYRKMEGTETGHFSILFPIEADETAYVVDPPDHLRIHALDHISEIYTSYVVLTGSNVEEYRSIRGRFSDLSAALAGGALGILLCAGLLRISQKGGSSKIGGTLRKARSLARSLLRIATFARDPRASQCKR